MRKEHCLKDNKKELKKQIKKYEFQKRKSWHKKDAKKQKKNLVKN